MLRNYLTISLRNLARQKGFSTINILGLAVSMSVCLLIILFIKDLKSYDRFHDHSDRIYRVYSDFKAYSNPDADLYATTPASLAPILRSEVPGVEDAVRIRRFGGVAIAADTTGATIDHGLAISGLYAGPSFFNVFSFNLQRGDTQQALARPGSIILSPDVASKFFGDADPVGRVLTLEEQGDFLVTGLLEEPPGKSHLQFEVLVSFATLDQTPEGHTFINDWRRTTRSSYTFVLLDESTTPNALEQRLPGVIEQHFAGTDQEYVAGLYLQGITAINLGKILGNQLNFPMPAVVGYFLAGLALIIMLAACFNYVGLSIARALGRAREVGIRKVVGAQRGQIVRQFLMEAVLMAFFALLAGAAILVWLLPAFNGLLPIRLSGMEISAEWTDATVYLLFLGFSVLVGLGAGLYPALYLSSFLPARVLKGLTGPKGSSGSRLRKTLMVGQFALSFVFIVTTALMYRQVQLMTDMDYGFTTEHLLNVDLQDVPYDRFRATMLGQAGVTNMSATSNLPASGTREEVWLKTPGMDEAMQANVFSIDPHFLDNLGLEVVAGRSVSDAFPTDRENAVLINETAVRVLGLGTPQEAVGQTVVVDDERSPQVVGVVQDYQFDLPFMAIAPLVLHYDPAQFQYANLRIQPGMEAQVEATLKAAWPSFGATQPLEYAFFEVQLTDSPEMTMFHEILGIMGLLAGFAVFIACLGLLGMAAYNGRIRLKEIGVRKVLGASTPAIVLLLSKDFLRLIVIAVVLAAPVAWFVNNLWLQTMSNRVDLGVGLFLLCTAALLALALLTIGSQTVSAAQVNPVDTLRSGE